MTLATVEILSPEGGRPPMVAYVPHASTVIPDDVRGELLISPAEQATEPLRLTDWYTEDAQ